MVTFKCQKSCFQNMQGLGNAYLGLQSIGITVFGGVVFLIGGLGLVIANTPTGKIIMGGLAAIGLMIIWAGLKTKEYSQTNSEGADKAGIALLGMAALGSLGALFKRK
jgi:hypothetical protein